MDSILYSVADCVATVTLNRPDRLNAFTPEMGRSYNQAIRRADADPDVRVVVVTGAGRGFCAGADLALFDDDASVLKAADPHDSLAPELNARIRKPVIAAVNGPAAGVGFTLMLTADVRFVAEQATLTTAYTRLGLVAEYGTAWLLPRLIGVERAVDLLLSARRFTGEEACRLGVVSRALPAEEVLPAALAYAGELARNCSPRALATVKAQVWRDLESTFDDALQRSRALMVASFDSPDLAEGAQAMAERREPKFAPLDPPE